MLRAVRSLPLILLLFPSCGGGGGGKSDPNGGLPPGPGTFSASPLEVSRITDLEPLGWLNPPGHTFPTDHVYLYYAWTYPNPMPPPSQWPVLPVHAPGSGTVNWILATAGQPDQKVMVQMSSTFSYYLDHVVLDPGIVVGTKVVAGQRVGTTGSASAAVDLGVINTQVALTGFVNPARYGSSVNCDSPYKYFTEPLKSQLYGLVRRSGADKDGRIDHDVRGRLIGNWFHESVALADSMGPLAWPKEMAFVPDPNVPSKPRVSLGGSEGLRGVWRPSPGDPDFAQVSVASGKVAYRLLYLDESFPTRSGLLIVQLLDDTRIKVQVFPGSSASDGDFTSAALIYTR